MFIDTHCHLDITAKGFEEKFDSNDFDLILDIINRAKKEKVGLFVNIGTDLESSGNSVEMAKKFEQVFSTVGIHPCDVKEEWKKSFEEIKKLAKKDKVVGIGETGLDFFHKPFCRNLQEDAFKAHIELSLEFDLPLVIHTRDSIDETLKILEPYKNEARGVFHCFQQSMDIAKEITEMKLGNGARFYLGIDGPITYKKNDYLREVVKAVPLETLVLETDAPFLPPIPHRGKKNFPEFIPLIAQEVANVRGISIEEVEAATTFNAKKLFGLV
jgi:TatD DNase family protein